MDTTWILHGYYHPRARNGKTMKLLKLARTHHPKADADIIYLPRKEKNIYGTLLESKQKPTEKNLTSRTWNLLKMNRTRHLRKELRPVLKNNQRWRLPKNGKRNHCMESALLEAIRGRCGLQLNPKMANKCWA